jgi:hypothetical protein
MEYKKTKIERKLTCLADKWNLYYHLPFDKTWDENSYKLIMENIYSIEQLIAMNETMPNEVIRTCMLFVMKSGIMPLWEDPMNRNGGAFSYKISIKNVPLVWRHLLYLLGGNSLTIDVKHMSRINGLSISPKKGFCIVKIWLCDCSLQNPEIISAIPDLTREGCLFTQHKPEF